jgi:hypothetical protein
MLPSEPDPVDDPDHDRARKDKPLWVPPGLSLEQFIAASIADKARQQPPPKNPSTGNPDAKQGFSADAWM